MFLSVSQQRQSTLKLSSICQNTLKRMIGRRGLPTDIYSDHGTNFVGANSKLKELKSIVHISS